MSLHLRMKADAWINALMRFSTFI